MASFHTNKSRVIFHNAFHGRTSAAVATTDNKIVAPINAQQIVTLPLND
jgi:acetylornithine aminotransferase